jgi:A/G-specific adenine glycosylase
VETQFRKHQPEEARQDLLDWFLKNARVLPFRGTKNPYHIWVSEVMLQQTRVNTVLVSFENFIQTFPTLSSLATSPIEDVLAHWKGLGYYSRAHNLHKGAKFIQENFNEQFPTNLSQALSVPGIGEYTARAVLSIAFNLPLAVLDGNVKRVLARLFLFEEDIQKNSSSLKLQKLADEFLSVENPSFHNQAMMELGALVCLPKNPVCPACPLSWFCQAKEAKMEKLLPYKTKPKKMIDVTMKLLVLTNEDKILLLKDSKRRFFKTIYSLPYTLSGLPETENPFLVPFLKDARLLFPEKIQHSITNHKITIEVYTNTIDSSNVLFSEYPSVLWTDIESLSKDFPSSISRKLLTIFQRGNFLKNIGE